MHSYIREMQFDCSVALVRGLTPQTALERVTVGVLEVSDRSVQDAIGYDPAGLVLARQILPHWALMLEISPDDYWVTARPWAVKRLSADGGAVCVSDSLPNGNRFKYGENGRFLVEWEVGNQAAFWGEEPDRFRSIFREAGIDLDDDDLFDEQLEEVAGDNPDEFLMKKITGVTLTKDMFQGDWLGAPINRRQVPFD